jgi:hypothetical protein
MQTLATLTGHLTRIVQDASYPDLFTEFINKERRKIAGRVKLPALRSVAVVNTVVGDYSAPMPDDYQHELFYCFDQTKNFPVPVYKSMNLLEAGGCCNDINSPGSIYGVVVELAKNPQAAIGIITLAGLPVADETFIVGSQTFIFKVARGTTGEVTIGADAAATAANIVIAITADIPTIATASALLGVVTVTSVALTAAANDTIFTTSATNMTMDGSDTLGGTQRGVKTAWLRYSMVPSDSHALRIDYFAFPVDLVADDDVPYELPSDDFQYDLIIRSVVFECFDEIYSEDKPGIPDRWERKREQAFADLKLFLGPYAPIPEGPTDTMGWGFIVHDVDGYDG